MPASHKFHLFKPAQNSEFSLQHIQSRLWYPLYHIYCSAMSPFKIDVIWGFRNKIKYGTSHYVIYVIYLRLFVVIDYK